MDQRFPFAIEGGADLRRNDSEGQGSKRAPRVWFSAPSRKIPSRSWPNCLVRTKARFATGEGAGRDTRGRVRSPFLTEWARLTRPVSARISDCVLGRSAGSLRAGTQLAVCDGRAARTQHRFRDSLPRKWPARLSNSGQVLRQELSRGRSQGFALFYLVHSYKIVKFEAVLGDDDFRDQRLDDLAFGFG